MSFSDKFVAPLKERWPWGEDQSTLSNYQDVRTDHLDLDWTIHWDQKVIVGGIQLKMTATKDIDHVLLDSSYLDIKKVFAFEREVKWSLGKKVGTMGEGLKIVLDQPLKAGQVSGSISLRPAVKGS
jgi:leukotriene-A4 hydrolase